MYNGNLRSVQEFIGVTGVTFPVLQNAGYLQQPRYYGIIRDNYVIVDTEGIVRYTSVNEPFNTRTGRFHDAHIRETIRSLLPTGVEPSTWTKLKGLYR